MRKLYTFTLIALLAAVACEKKSSTTTTTTAAETTTPSTSNAAAFDLQFIDMMVPHHEQAVMISKMAEQRAEHAELKTMARKMIDDQSREISEMKSMRKEWFASDATPPMDKMPMPQGMESHPKMDVNAMHSQLETAKPFDKAFIDMMIEHHKMAIHAAELQQQKGARAELKSAASKMATEQKKEVAHLESLRAQWYPGK
jgi:uncharacterized protein (DUF305 family)